MESKIDLNEVVTIVEGLLYACKKINEGKVVFYLKGVKHYDSGKTFTWVQFIERSDYEQYQKQFKK